MQTAVNDRCLGFQTNAVLRHYFRDCVVEVSLVVMKRLGMCCNVLWERNGISDVNNIVRLTYLG